MGPDKKKQLKLTAVYVVLICLFTVAGLWLRKNPLFTGQGFHMPKTPAPPVSTYTPYEHTELVAVMSQETPAAGPAEPAQATPRFYTSERAVAFTFSGLRNERELEGVLAALKNTNSRATFFVTAEEMENQAGLIEEIQRAGHSLGISVPLTENARADQLLKSIQAQAQELRTKYRARYEIFLMPAAGSGSAALLQAAASGGFRVLTALKEAVPEKASRMTDADQVLALLFNENEGALQRGEIVHFQMGIFQYSDAILGELVERLIAGKCVYPVRSCDAIAENRDKIYEYPLPDSRILPAVKNKIHPGHLAGMSPDEVYQVIKDGYIGIEWIVSTYFLPGFTPQQADQLDKTGIIKNDQNYVFLTFDDWGTDATVERLLQVLDKHNATATFFVKTEYVPYNPNLLRGIAAAGNTVGAHTHAHMELANEIYPTYYKELDEEQRAALEQDIVTCYDTMQHIIGDMVDADGKPSLSLLFRQPTLAVGKNGLETVFDCGYTHAIAGYYTTTDYKAESVEALVKDLREHIVPGAVLVMHFSDNAQYTAEALDILLTEYEDSGSEYRFVGLNKVL